MDLYLVRNAGNSNDLWYVITAYLERSGRGWYANGGPLRFSTMIDASIYAPNEKGALRVNLKCIK